MSNLPQLQPLDVHNKKLQSNVHPTDWQNPTPDGTYNMVVIGGGTAGLVTAAGAAGLGAREGRQRAGRCTAVVVGQSARLQHPARTVDAPRIH